RVLSQAPRAEHRVQLAARSDRASVRWRADRTHQPQRAQPDPHHPLQRTRPGSLELRQPGDRPEHRRRPVPAEPELLPVRRPGVLTMTTIPNTPTMRATSLALLLAAGVAACNFDIVNPNAPEQIGTNPSQPRVAAAATG